MISKLQNLKIKTKKDLNQDKIDFEDVLWKTPSLIHYF